MRRCDLAQLKLLVLTPLKKRADGAGVSLARIIISNVRDEELDERAAGLFAGGLDETAGEGLDDQADWGCDGW